MRDLLKTAEQTLDELKKAGLGDSAVNISHAVKNEMNIDAGDLSLYRSTTNIDMSVKGIKDKRNGQGNTNNLSDESIKKLAGEVRATADASEKDEANDISPMQKNETVVIGDSEPNNVAMYDRLQEFLEYTKSKYPKLQLIQCILDFTSRRSIYANSNGVRFDETMGVYSFSTMFSAKDGEKSASFNYTGANSLDLNKPLKDWCDVDELFLQMCGQLDTKSIEAPFVGEVILTPPTVNNLLSSLIYSFATDFPLITGTSIWKDKLGQQVVSPELTLRCEPTKDSQLSCGYSLFTNDGFKTENEVIIDKGVLKTFCIGQYGEKKTGFARSKSGYLGDSVDAGNIAKADMIKSVKKGILLGRFSGANPASNGDFSGVAKNSYLIENGKITQPLSETMIAGNLVSIMNAIKGISKERIDYGYTKTPWIHVDGVSISGK